MEIILKDITLWGYHGVTEHERKSGTEFCVNIIISLMENEEERITKLTDTIDYSEVFFLLKNEFAKTEQLLETLADRIAGIILSNYNIARWVELTIMKVTAPISGLDGQVGIRIKRQKK